MSIYLLTQPDMMQFFLQKNYIEHKDIIHFSQVDTVFRKCIKEQIDIFLRIYTVPPALEFLGFKMITSIMLQKQTAHLSAYFWEGGKLPDLVHTLKMFNPPLPFYNKLLSILPKTPTPVLPCFLE